MQAVRLAVTMGDPAGIGPEIIVRAAAARPAMDVTVFGNPAVLSRAARTLGVSGPACGAWRVHAVATAGGDEVRSGEPSVEAGAAQIACLAAATSAVRAGEVEGLVTAPINKDWAARAGFDAPGHTEYLARASGVERFAMMLAGPRLRVTLATIHIGLRDVPTRLESAGLAGTIALTAKALAYDFALTRPRVAVAGLNPHAGESGRFGDEEARVIAPAIARARTELAEAGVDAELSGPHVPDAVFRHAVAGHYDAVVAMYHDQALIPIKLIDFEAAVNITLGLPFVRTSPDHGTAYDIAGTGRARPDSLIAALDLAAAVAERRRTFAGTRGVGVGANQALP